MSTSRSFIIILALVAGILLVAECLFGVKMLMLAEIPTHIIVAGCAACFIFMAAVVLAVFKVITNTTQDK